MNPLNIAAACAVALAMSCAHLLDGPDELDAATDVAAQVEANQAADRRAQAEATCFALYGSSALFFETAHGHQVCRNTAT